MTYAGMFARPSSQRDTRQVHLNSLPKNPPIPSDQGSSGGAGVLWNRAQEGEKTLEVVRPEAGERVPEVLLPPPLTWLPRV